MTSTKKKKKNPYLTHIHTYSLPYTQLSDLVFLALGVLGHQRKGLSSASTQGLTLLGCFLKMGTKVGLLERRPFWKRQALWKWRAFLKIMDFPYALRCSVTIFAPALWGKMVGCALPAPQEGHIAVKSWSTQHAEQWFHICMGKVRREIISYFCIFM